MRAALVALLIALPAAAQEQRPTAPLPRPSAIKPGLDVPKIAYTEFTLPNGLRVIMHEDHSSPIVAVEVWYNVGSKQDPRGKSGLAHVFEHMMFRGTANLGDDEFMRPIQEAGGVGSANTTNDWTRYFEIVPTNILEPTLWAEAERMRNLTARMDSTRFERERDAVRNEFGQRFEGVMSYAASSAMTGALFPSGAYAVPVIGHMAELNLATVDDLRRFYQTYYVPNNAVLVVAGDITPADARRKVERQFAAIPRGKPLPPPDAVGTPLGGEQRIVIEFPGNLRALWVGWRGAKSANADRAAVLALSSIMTDRLRRLLVTTRQVAVSLSPVYNQNFDLQESAILQAAISLTPTASATEAERLVDSVVASIRKDGVTDSELRRWGASYRMQKLTAMQSVQTKAQDLGDAALNQGDPLANFKVMERAQLLRPADVLAAARKYLTPERVVLSVVPPGKLNLISKPELPFANVTRK